MLGPAEIGMEGMKCLHKNMPKFSRNLLKMKAMFSIKVLANYVLATNHHNSSPGSRKT